MKPSLQESVLKMQVLREYEVMRHLMLLDENLGTKGADSIKDLLLKTITLTLEEALKKTPKEEERALLKPCTSTSEHSHKDRYADGWNSCRTLTLQNIKELMN